MSTSSRESSSKQNSKALLFSGEDGGLEGRDRAVQRLLVATTSQNKENVSSAPRLLVDEGDQRPAAGSSVLDRVRQFLPQLAKANDDLFSQMAEVQQSAGDDAAAKRFRIDQDLVEGKDDETEENREDDDDGEEQVDGDEKQYVQFNLAMGVLVKARKRKPKLVREMDSAEDAAAAAEGDEDDEQYDEEEDYQEDEEAGDDQGELLMPGESFLAARRRAQEEDAAYLNVMKALFSGGGLPLQTAIDNEEEDEEEDNQEEEEEDDVDSVSSLDSDVSSSSSDSSSSSSSSSSDSSSESDT